ncbi:MAG: HDOD domain-containing protein [Candidatus Sumerlaeia bacterium]
MKKRILFVDDEERVLEAIRRMMRPMRKEWDVEAVNSGKKALEILENEKFDVIVSDIKMPGMDGAQLLDLVRRKYPGIARVVLSGHADKEVIIKLVGTVHQYLSKPCNGEALKNVVARACQMSNLMASERMRNVVSQIDSLPSLPQLHIQLIEELKQSEPDMGKIEKIVSQDIGMSSKILQLVNSTFFGLAHHISSPGHAVSMLGLDTIRAMVYSIHIFSQFDKAALDGFPMEALWEHSTAVGTWSRRVGILAGANAKLIDASFIAGLLHDIGILVVASQMPGEYREVMKLAQDPDYDLVDAEREITGASHAEVGAYLIGIWGLPAAIVEATLFHHEPQNSHGEGFQALTAVHMANGFFNEQGDWLGPGLSTGLDRVYLAKLGLEDQIENWRAKARQPLERE